MQYITYKRFKKNGIDGAFNLPFGTIVDVNNGILWHNARRICFITSENGWEHFHPNTPEGEHRHCMLTALYQWYNKNGCGDDFADEKWPDAENGYWKNRLRTASTERLEKIYQEKIGGVICT